MAWWSNHILHWSGRVDPGFYVPEAYTIWEPSLKKTNTKLTMYQEHKINVYLE